MEEEEHIFHLALLEGSLRHNLDVMHIEKNVMENILSTLLNLKDQTKDNYKARLDLAEMGIRSELHLQ